MRKVAICWEYGANLGYVLPVMKLAQSLLAVGYQVSFFVPDPSVFIDRFNGVSFFACPKLPTSLPGNTYSFSHILYNVAGWGHADNVLAHTKSWASVLAGFDIIIASYAPGAILAAKVLGVKYVEVGTGWCVPPLSNPMPLFLKETPLPEDVLLSHEAQCVSSVNYVLRRFGLCAVDSLSSFFDSPHRLVFGSKRFDYYKPRTGEVIYVRPEIASGGVKPDSFVAPSKANRPTVFCYLQRDNPQISIILNSLRNAGFPTVAHVPGALPEWRQLGSLQVYPDPIDMSWAIENCDIAVAHGFGVLSSFVAKGKPVVSVADNLERQVLGLAIERANCGVMIHQQSSIGIIDAISRAFDCSGTLGAHLEMSLLPSLEEVVFDILNCPL